MTRSTTQQGMRTAEAVVAPVCVSAKSLKYGFERLQGWNSIDPHARPFQTRT